MEHDRDIIEDTENENEAIDNKCDKINKEFGYDNNILVSGGVKIANVKGRYVVQDLLIQIETDEIGKVTKEEKSNIIKFNDEEERVQAPTKLLKVGKRM
jgi:hypothetical protein